MPKFCEISGIILDMVEMYQAIVISVPKIDKTKKIPAFFEKKVKASFFFSLTIFFKMISEIILVLRKYFSSCNLSSENW